MERDELEIAAIPIDDRPWRSEAEKEWEQDYAERVRAWSEHGRQGRRPQYIPYIETARDVICVPLRASDIYNAIAKYGLSDFRACWRAFSRGHQDVRGEITFSLEIDPRGDVCSVKLSGFDAGTLGDKQLLDCLQQSLKRLIIDVPMRHPLRVIVGLDFEPQSQTHLPPE
jgi:hypothetical protein